MVLSIGAVDGVDHGHGAVVEVGRIGAEPIGTDRDVDRAAANDRADDLSWSSVLITATLPLLLATYSRAPSGLSAIPSGPSPTATLVSNCLVVRLTTVTLSSSRLVT